jgi:small subunit ribosomal protein S13
MVYILNKYIHPKKTVKKGLTTIYGIGPSSVEKISNGLCFHSSIRIAKLGPTQISLICKYIMENFKTGSQLKKSIQQDIQRYIKIKSYKGSRHRKGLPLRGQRTKTNSKTSRKIRLLK